MDWRMLKLGDKVNVLDEYDLNTVWFIAEVTSIEENHAIATENDGTTYWIDDDTAYLFSKKED